MSMIVTRRGGIKLLRMDMMMMMILSRVLLTKK